MTPEAGEINLEIQRLNRSRLSTTVYARLGIIVATIGGAGVGEIINRVTAQQDLDLVAVPLCLASVIYGILLYRGAVGQRANIDANRRDLMVKYLHAGTS